MENELINSALYDVVCNEYERSYVLADKPVDLKAISVKTVDVCHALPKLSPNDVEPLFLIARKNFAAIPQVRHLSDSVPMLNAEREACKFHRALPPSDTLMQRINRAEAMKIYASRTRTYDEYMANPYAYSCEHMGELRSIYDYDNAPPPGCCAGLNELRTN